MGRNIVLESLLDGHLLQGACLLCSLTPYTHTHAQYKEYDYCTFLDWHACADSTSTSFVHVVRLMN